MPIIKIKKTRMLQKRITAIILIAVISISLFPIKTHALILDPINPFNGAKQAMEGIMEKFGFKKEAIAEAARNFNVLGNKKQNPQVMVTFSPTNPNPGEKITATAEPMYFGNRGESLYYTWYLRHSDDEDKNDIEKFKERAARIIASDGYERKESDGYVDNSGYKAFMGGDDQEGKGKETGNHCFFYDVDKGAEYEFTECQHLFPHAPGAETGDGVFTDGDEGEETFWNTNPANPDTAGLGQTDEATVAGLGVKAFTWTYQEGDQVGVAIEGVSYVPTAYEDSSYKIMWALSKNKCDPACPEGDDECDPKTGMKDLSVEEETFGEKELIFLDPPYWPDCPDGCTFPRTIRTKQTKYSNAPSSSYLISSTREEIVNQVIQLSARKYISGGVEGGDGGDGGSGGTDGSGGEGGDGGDGGSAELGPGICESPSPQELDDEESGIPGCYTVDGISGTYENGTPVIDQSCCPTGGLYIEANEECPLTQTSCTIISSNESALEDENASINTTMDPDKNGDGNLFRMEMKDMNKCLLDNFVDPTNSGEGGAGGGGANKKLDVSLSYSPKNPINVPLPVGNDPDTYAINADEVTVEAMMDNAKDSEFLNYTWEVFRGDIPSSEEGEWGEALTKDQLDGAGLTTGAGLKNFKFNMRFDEEGGGFLKVKLTVEENAYNGTRSGHSDVIIPIAINKKELKVYSTMVSNDLNLTLSKDAPKCIDEETRQNLPVCEVVKNQIIHIEASGEGIAQDGAGLDNLSWTIDGEPLKNQNSEAKESTNTTTYFPVTKGVGETFDVSLAATVDPTEENPAGEKINLTRIFKVIDPKITVTSDDTDTCVPVLKGFYIDSDDVSWPDYSETEFETLSGADMKLQATFTGATPPEDQILWSVDNIPQVTGDYLVYTATKPVGESYNITVGSLYSQDNNTAKALLKYWGINYDGLYEKNSSTIVSVKTVGILSDTTARGNVKKFLAALATGVPSYLSFLFRIILTTALLLFTYRVIFILLPNARKEEI